MNKTFQLACFTTCLITLCCVHSYSQAGAQFKKAKTKQTNTQIQREVIVFEAPSINADAVYDDAYMTVIDYSAADANVFTQKTFSAPLYDDQISVSSTSISPRSAFKNLEVYLIYGDAETDKKKYVPLHEALKKGMAKIDETSTVSKLAITNNSDQYIYINYGDIVKGGRQDRTIKYDIVVAPHAQNVDLASFCVERSRWSQRQEESSAYFSSSEKSLSSSDLKVAARHNSNQSEVWSEVKTYQVTTNANLNTDAQFIQTINGGDAPVQNTVTAMDTFSFENGMQTNVVGSISSVDVTKNASSSSLELTLESKELNKINEEYKKTIIEQLGNRDRAVGLAYYINGKLYSIDVYNNHQLFADMFDKLLDAAIAEAISVTSSNAELPKGDIQLVNDLLKTDAKVYEEVQVNAITQSKTSENNINKDMWIFSTIDQEEKTWIHRNWIIK